LQWSFLYLCVIFEWSLIMLMLLPFGSSKIRGVIVNTLSFLANIKAINMAAKVLGVISLFLWLDAMRTIFFLREHIGAHHEQGLGHDSVCQEKLRLARNERNSYITGFAFFGMLVIWRLHATLVFLHENRLKAKKYEELMKEKELQDDLSESKLLSKGSKSSQSSVNTTSPSAPPEGEEPVKPKDPVVKKNE